MTAIAWVLGAGCFVNMAHPSGSLPFFGALIALIVLMQILYLKRLGSVRFVASQLAREFPADRFLVGNVRYVRPSDRGPDAVDFTTTILQFGGKTLSLWNPDAPSHPLVAIPFKDLDVEVTKKPPPRWALVAPYSAATPHIALFAETGLGFESEVRMNELARELFHQGGWSELEPTREDGSETL